MERNMNMRSAFKGFSLGAASGALFGWAAMLVNHLTGVFEFEQSAMTLLVTFGAGGAVFGAVAGLLMSFTDGLFLDGRPVLKAVVISAGFWLALRVSGAALSALAPLRYHAVSGQAVQGFLLSCLLGLFLGFLWKSRMADEVFGGN